MPWPGSKRPPAAVGLVVDGTSLHLAELGLSHPATEGTVAVTLPLDPNEAEVLRERVASLPGRTRRCVVGLPAEWFMTVASAVPELSEEDRQSFLTLEAEKGFPCDPAELRIKRSELMVDGTRYVTQLGLRTEQVQQLEERLRAAGLRPASMTLTLAALDEPPPTGQLENGRLLVVQSASSVSTLFTVDGELIQVRALDGSLAEPDALARELRITLEDLPPPLRSRLGSVRILGPLASSRTMVEKLRSVSAFAHLRIEAHEQEPAAQAGVLVRRWLGPGSRLPEFLLPRPCRWKQWLHRYNARRVGMIGAAAAAALLLLAGSVAWQEYRSWSLRSEWEAMKPAVEVLNGVQDRIREFRPWHDTSFSTLSTLKLGPTSFRTRARSRQNRSKSKVTRPSRSRAPRGRTRPYSSRLIVCDSVLRSPTSRSSKSGESLPPNLRSPFNWSASRAHEHAQTTTMVHDRGRGGGRPAHPRPPGHYTARGSLEETIRGNRDPAAFHRRRPGCAGTEGPHRITLEGHPVWQSARRRRHRGTNRPERLRSVGTFQSHRSRLHQTAVEAGRQRQVLPLECRVDASGPLANLTRLLHEVERSPLALRIDSIELSSRDERGQMLSLGLVVTGLRLIPLEARP